MLTLLLADVPPPLQLYVTPEVGEEAVKVTVALVQVSEAGVAMLAPGAVLFCVTETDADAEHPLPGSVTVTVYAPAAFTIVLAAVGVLPAGLTELGPAHE